MLAVTTIKPLPTILQNDTEGGNQDGGVGRYTAPPRTTKRRKTII